MTAQDQSRAEFESAVIERLKESGFLEVEIRVECLVRVEDSYQDPQIAFGWAMWQAARALSDGVEPAEYQCRTKPDWDEKFPWSDWEKCSAASAADFERTPRLHNWLYEVRRLYAAPQVLAMGRVPRGYESGIQTGERVTLNFKTQEAATVWFESFMDAYDAAAPRQPAAQPDGTLAQIAAVAACFGDDWPDVEGEPEVLRRVKWAARQLKAAQEHKPQPLTDGQIAGVGRMVRGTIYGTRQQDIAFARAIERAHGIGGSNAD